jgi:hypothetical protein
MIKKLKYFISPAILLLPIVTFAQFSGNDAISSFIMNVLNLTQRLVPTLIGLALALFLWGILRYLFSKDGPSKKEARDFMMWGIVALFVMVSVWGLVRIVQNIVLGDDANTMNDIKFPSVVVPNSVQIR